MTHVLLTSAWLAAMVLAGPTARAQTPEPQPQAPPNVAEPQPDLPDPTASPTDAPVTLTGCLRRTDEDADSSTLTLVVTTDAGKTDPRLTKYAVVAAHRDVRLAEHVGHLVTVKGKLEVDREAPTRPDAPEPNDLVPPTVPSGSTGVDTIPDPQDAPVAGRPRTPPGAPVNATFFVREVEMIASSCPAAPSS